MNRTAALSRHSPTMVEPLGRPAPARRGGALNRTVLWALGSVLGPLLRGFSAVRYTSASGVVVLLPVQLARDAHGGDIAVAWSGSKRWWRHFRRPASAELWVDGSWRGVTVRALKGDDADAAVRRYVARFPSARRALRPAPGPAPRGSQMLRVDGPLEDALLSGASLRRTWIVTVAIAELLGFVAPAMVGVLTVAAPWPAALSLVVAAGALEGAMLGWGQVVVLRRALPGVRSARWVALTSAAAVLAYAIGMGPSTWASGFVKMPVAAQAILAVLAGTALLASIGTAQWLELRRHAHHAWRWILWVAFAWLAALAAFLAIATPLWQPGQPVWTTVLIGGGAAIVMATLQAGVTAVGLDRMLHSQHSDDPRRITPLETRNP
jgi:hypothetical protein